MRKQIANLALIALLIYPMSLSSQNSFYLSLDANDTAGDQAVISLNTSPDQVVSIQIFGTNIQDARSLSARFEYDENQVVYEGFDAGDVLPDAEVLPKHGTNPTYVEIGIGTLGGQATVNSGLVGTIRFRTTAVFSGTAIRLVRGVIGRGGQLETVTLTARVELRVSTAPSPDFDGDGVVGIPDFLLFVNQFGSSYGDGTYQAKYDLDSNGVIGIPDFLLFINDFGKEVPTTGGGGSGGNPDLIVESPSVSDEILSPGQSFTLGATVRNQGNGQSAATTLRYYRSTNSTITTSDEPVSTDAVNSLSASETSSESISLQAPNTPGSYYYGACVESVSGESDTENNCSTGVRVTVASSNTFDATVAQIKNLKAEFEQVNQEIAQQWEDHPLNAPKDQFESDAEYAARIGQLDSIMARSHYELRERYKFKDKQTQIGQLYRRVFPTNDITVTLDTYNVNEEYFPTTVEIILNGRSESYSRRLYINRDDARSLFSNWDRVTKTGYLSIDPGYRQALALVKLKNPIGQQGFTIEFVTDEIYNLGGGSDAVAFSPDGKYMAASDADVETNLWRVSDGQKIRGSRSGAIIYANRRYGLTFSPDGRYLVSGFDNSVIFWELSSSIGTIVRRIEIDRSIARAIAFSPDGRYLATDGYRNNNVTIFGASSGQQIRQMDAGDIYTIAFSPDGNYIAGGDDDGRVTLWEVSSGTVVWRKETGGREVHSIAISPDGNYLAAGGEYRFRIGGSDGIVTIWRVSSGQKIQQIERNTAVRAVAISPDGNYLAVRDNAIYSGTITFYRIPANITLTTRVTKEKEISTGGGLYADLAWSPYGNLISDGNKVYRTLLQPDIQED